MQRIDGLDRLHEFFEEIRDMYETVDLKNNRFILALMSDLIPNSVQLKRCVRTAYESRAMDCIIDISGNPFNVSEQRNKALHRMVEYSFMNKQIAAAVVDSLIASIYPSLGYMLEAESFEEENKEDNEYMDINDQFELMHKLIIRLIGGLKNKLRSDLDEHFTIYRLLGMTPPEEYSNMDLDLR